LLSFWLPWIYSPFPFFMESCNGLLLQLIDCIESTPNEVKRKMIVSTPSAPAIASRADEDVAQATDNLCFAFGCAAQLRMKFPGDCCVFRKLAASSLAGWSIAARNHLAACDIYNGE
jgi:hypothetical protein